METELTDKQDAAGIVICLLLKAEGAELGALIAKAVLDALEVPHTDQLAAAKFIDEFARENAGELDA